MKSFKKFVIIAVMPYVLITIISVLLSQSLNQLSNFKLNFYLIGLFVIISFCSVYLVEYLEKRTQRKIANYAYSLLILSPLLFLFSLLTFHFLFYFFDYQNAMFSTILGICIFLTISFALEIKALKLHTSTH